MFDKAIAFASRIADFIFNNPRYLITLSVAIFVLCSDIPYFRFLDIYPDSARYLLSSLVQCEAAIIAIVISLVLIAVQFAASSWSGRIVDELKRTLEFWMLIILYCDNDWTI